MQLDVRANRHEHLFFSVSQNGHPAGQCAQPHAELSVHTRLFGDIQLKQHHEFLITNNDETAYREKLRLLEWCQENNLSLSVSAKLSLITGNNE